MNEFERKLLDAVEYASWIGSLTDPERELLYLESYTYTARLEDPTFALDIESDPTEIEIVMDSDSEFIAVALAGCAVVDTTDPAIVDPANANRVTEFSPAVLVQITDQSSGKTWWNQPAPLPLVCGAGGFPFLMTSPRIVKPRSTLTVSLSLPDEALNAVTTTVLIEQPRIALHGAKAYYAGPTP